MEKNYTIPKLLLEEMNSESCIIVDVRSPKEYSEFSFPNSINIPIFNNDERAKVGTIYKQQGKGIAVKKGLEIFSKKITFIYDEILHQLHNHPNKKLVFLCARGGMRSSSLVSTFNMLGVNCFQLEGGIRSYRQFIIDSLRKISEESNKFIVISGNTGTRKTDLLLKLKDEGYPVIDLEGLANHRGSVFGGIGLTFRSQKQFEALLVEQLQKYQDSGYFIIEAESKRIGNIVIPDFILKGKEVGVKIELKYPLLKRVDHLLSVYQPEKNHHYIVEAFERIKKRFKDEDKKEIENAFISKNYQRAFQSLLTNYYDPMYEYAFHQYSQPIYLLEFEEINDAFLDVKKIIHQL